MEATFSDAPATTHYLNSHPVYFFSPAPFQVLPGQPPNSRFIIGKQSNVILFRRGYYRFPGDFASKDRVMYSGAGYRISRSRAVTYNKIVAGNEFFSNPPIVMSRMNCHMNWDYYLNKRKDMSSARHGTYP